MYWFTKETTNNRILSIPDYTERHTVWALLVQ